MPVPTTVPAVMIPQPLRSAVPTIEPLESRIAPAAIPIFVGQLDQDDTEYGDAPFVKTTTSTSDPISQVLGANPDVYYLKLTPGDSVAIFSGGGYVDFIRGPELNSGIQGTVVAVFHDFNHDGEVQTDEFTGLSLGKNVKINVSGTVFGDVVANYNDATGAIGGASEPAGVAKELLNNSISFFGAASVTGNLIAGGTIQNVDVTGSINQILTGSAAHNVTYDFNGPNDANNPNDPNADGGDTLNVVPAAGKAGPNISKITLGSVTKIWAGGGGAGGNGGNISNVTLVSDTNGWIVQGGDGGDGGSGKPNGGKGGNVTNVFANGLDANTSDATANDVVKILGGKGGNGNANGGKGGTVKNVSIGFESAPQGGVQRSINSIADSVQILGGLGGTGKVGGAGGAIVSADVFASPTLSGNDLVLRGGTGGDSTGSGKAGAGGSVTDFDVSNPGISAEAQQSRMFVDAGDGGAAPGSGGAKGGSVEKGTLIGFSIGITGGNGSLGANGGAGGNVRSILMLDGFFGVQPKNVSIDAGSGGIGTAGKGGKGGLIDGITVRNAELSQFDINEGLRAGSGGDSQKGPGAAGGNVSNLTINDLDSVAASEVIMKVSAGDGGKGGTTGNGGKGGLIGGKNVFDAVNASLLINGGQGGAATGGGSGGAGGGVTDVSFSGAGDVAGAPVTGSIIAGSGGAGTGSGKGGVGGSLATLSVIADGDIALTAGTGGSAGSGASGKGGSISNGATISTEGSAIVKAGSAGTDGGKAGAGGGLSQINVQAATTIEIRSGDGSKGGAGGAIKEIGVSDVSQLAGPQSGLLIIAGKGSANGNVAGAGGSISGVDGFIATGGNTLIQAGDGGTGTAKAGAGGSVSTITLRGGGGATAIVDIEAGNAGDAPSAKTGAKGGNITDVGIGLNPFVAPPNPLPDPAPPIDPFQVQAGTLIRHIAAGDGGDGTKGGTGGSVQNVRAYYDIGAMSGADFGYDTMGGIFAGMAGVGSTAGTAGSVIGISADSIAAILAGRLKNGEEIKTGNLAASVEGIVLNTSEAAQVNANGTYLNYDTAGMVGAVRNPGVVGDPYNPPQPLDHPPQHANTFDLFGDPLLDEYVDNGDGKFGIGDHTNARTHGFVAALKFATSDKSPTAVRPEAVLTNGDSGGIEFIDLNNTNGQVVKIS